MPVFDLTISITTVLALCAIVSPILTAIINNCHQTKIKKMELKQEKYRNTVLHKRSVYENYLKSAGRCIYFADSDALKEYGEYYMAALICATPELRKLMISVNYLMLNNEFDRAQHGFEELTPLIYTEIEKL